MCRAVFAVLLFLLSVSSAFAATQTINTVPSSNATFISDLQTFLRGEISDRAFHGASGVMYGGIGATGASLTHTISALVAFPDGYYVSQAATSRTYTTTTRTYVYVRKDSAVTVTIAGAAITYGTNLVYAEMAAATAQPSTPSNIIPLFYADTDGTSITAVTDLRTGRASLAYWDTLSAALTTIGTSLKMTLVIPERYVIAATIDASTYTNIKYDMLEASGSFNVLSTFTFTLPSPSHIIASPNQQIFPGAGTLAFNTGGMVYPDWWGENTSPGTTNMEAKIESADTSLGSNKGTIGFTTGQYASVGDITFDSAVYLDFKYGSTINPATGKVITIACSSNIVAQKNVQIFSGAGTIVFSISGTVYPEWWGIDGTADEVQINAAIVSIQTAKGVCKLTGAYSVDATIIVRDGIDLIGEGQYSTIVTSNTTQNVVTAQTTNKISNFTIDGDSQITGSGIEVPVGEHNVMISNMYIYDTGYNSIVTSGAYDVFIDSCRLEGAGHRNINIGMDIPTSTGSHDITISNVIAKTGTKSNLIIAHNCSRVVVNNFISDTTTEAGSNGVWIAHTCLNITLNNVISLNSVASGLVIQAFSYQITVSNSQFKNNGLDGIHIIGAESDETPGFGDTTVIALSNCIMNGNTGSGLAIPDGGAYVSKNIIINGCIIYGNAAYGLDFSDPDSIALVVDGCIFSSNTSGDVNDTTTNGIVYGRNTGWVTQNFGVTGAIASGTTVSHGLDVTPTSVTVTAAETGPTDIYVTAVGAATFQINFGGGGNKTFYWYARK